MKHVYTFALAVIIGVVIAAAAAGEEPLQLSLPKIEAAHNAEVAVPVTFSTARDLGCLQMALVYDDKLLEVVNVTHGPLLPSKAVLEFDTTVPGRLGIGLLSGADEQSSNVARVKGDGIAFNVHFKILGHAGERSPLVPKKAQAWQVENEEIPIQPVDGEILIVGNSNWWYFLAIAAVLLIAVAFGLRRLTQRQRKVATA